MDRSTYDSTIFNANEEIYKLKLGMSKLEAEIQFIREDLKNSIDKAKPKMLKKKEKRRENASK